MECLNFLKDILHIQYCLAVTGQSRPNRRNGRKEGDACPLLQR
jgi:hypothetical protein